MLPTHLAATVLGCLLAARFVPGWDGRSWTLALLFGVAIDVDHLARVPAYLAESLPRDGLAALTPWALKAYGGGWTAFFHEPIGAAVVLAVSVAVGSAIPAASWALHRGLDTLVGEGLVEFAGPGEWGLLALLLLTIAILGDRHVRERWAGLTPRRWAALVAVAWLPSPSVREG